MLEIDISADDLVGSLLGLAPERQVSILDSCGVAHQDSHLLIAGVDPIESISIHDANSALETLDSAAEGDTAAIFTLSYDLGRILQNISTRHRPTREPLFFMSRFKNLIVHDYTISKTLVTGDERYNHSILEILQESTFSPADIETSGHLSSNISKQEYIKAVEAIKEKIRTGNTYQTNLTRKITVDLPKGFTADNIFWRLRRDHPAPFSAFIQRPDSTVISASPERFFKIENGSITASPIKGTRPRGKTSSEDEHLRTQLANSQKDRAENTMIVDLLRNDLGRVCEFGSVEVESLCKIEEYQSLFHMVSTINGRLRPNTAFSEILRALFPCGSITGAPKISTMKIIERLEPTARGLSMGAIGCYIPAAFGIGETIDLSVAIRTMVIRDITATFNVGGGIVIDSDPEKEWDETVVKSKALLHALGIEV